MAEVLRNESGEVFRRQVIQGLRDGVQYSDFSSKCSRIPLRLFYNAKMFAFQSYPSGQCGENRLEGGESGNSKTHLETTLVVSRKCHGLQR